MAQDYVVGGLANNAFDIDADANYIYLAVKGTTTPQILKMSTSIDADATTVFNPGGGTEVNLMAGDLSSYWVWAVGAFSGTDKVVLTEDGGASWYVQDEGDWVGVARPILVGPGNDALITTSTGLVFWQNRYEGVTQYWVERDLPGDIWAVDRVDDIFENVVIGAYWYTGDSSLLTHYSPNSGFNWEDITDAIPTAPITSIIIGR